MSEQKRDDFDCAVARIHRRRIIPSLIFNRDTAVALALITLIWWSLS